MKPETERFLSQIEDRLNTLGSNGQTVISETELMEIHNQLTTLAIHAEKELTSNNSIQISPSQAIFMKRMLAMAATIQSYQLLLSDRDSINTIYSRLLQLHITKDLDLANIESLLQKDSASSNFIKDAIRHTSVSLDSVVGIKETAVSIEQAVLQGPIIDNVYNFIILSGPPGTGKSTISHAMATQHSGGKYYNLNIGDLLSGTVGISEKGIRELFGQLEASTENVTLILDEADLILSDGVDKPTYFQSIRTTLQTEISGSRFLKSNVLIIAITNYLNKILDVFQRRASSIIYVPTPARNELIDMLVKEMSVQRAEVNPELIQILNDEFLNERYFWTAANLKYFLRNAKIEFFKRNKDLLKVFKSKDKKIHVISNMYLKTAPNTVERKVNNLPKMPIVLVPEIADFKAARNLVFVLNAEQHEEWRKINTLNPPSQSTEFNMIE